MSRFRFIVPLLALAVMAAACGEDPETSAGAPTGTTATGTTGPTATGPPSESPSVTVSATPSPNEVEVELEDGRHFGFIESVDLEGLALEFDLAYFLTGEEANAAAEEHGDEVPVPNDYYIVNDNPKIRTLGVAPDLEIVLFDWDRCCEETISGSLEGLAEAINGGEPVTVDGHLYQGPLSPYWLTVEGGAVTKIEEQYLP
jgi:hypothetical protein